MKSVETLATAVVSKVSVSGQIALENVTKAFSKAIAISEINFTVEPGEFVALVGRSGSGKSTLLRTITHLIKPDSGQVRVNGAVVSSLSPKQLRDLRTRTGFIFQHFGLVPSASALENVLMGSLGILKLPRIGSLSYPKDLRAKAISLLTKVGLSDQMAKRAEELSGGQMQRVAIARSLMLSPNILLADEPISSLDPANSADVMNLLRAVNSEGVTVLVSLHQVEYALKYSSRIIALKNGSVMFDKATNSLSKSEILKIYEDIDA